MSSESGNAAPRQVVEQGDVLRDNWGWFLVLGIAMIMVGTMAVILPGLAGLGIALLLGWLLLIGGIVQAIHAFYARAWSGFFIQALTAILYLMVGVMLLANPWSGLLMLTLVLTAFLLVEGIFKLALAWRIREAANWGWVLLSGLVSLALAAVIWANLPGDAFWVLGVLVGINILFSGCSMMMLALAAGGRLGGVARGGMTPKSPA